MSDIVWDDLPEGINPITDGDEIVGVAWADDVDVNVDALNAFLAKNGLPLMDVSKEGGSY